MLSFHVKFVQTDGTDRQTEGRTEIKQNAPGGIKRRKFSFFHYVFKTFFSQCHQKFNMDCVVLGFILTFNLLSANALNLENLKFCFWSRVINDTTHVQELSSAKKEFNSSV